jgi:DNA polymerase-3 subunit gamma/tau
LIFQISRDRCQHSHPRSTRDIFTITVLAVAAASWHNQRFIFLVIGMSYQVLARKWRPRRFAELVGQEHVVRALSNALDSGRMHHAFLFTGTRGVGKTTIARIFAKSLNCDKGTSSQPCGVCSACIDIDAGRFIDLLEIDAASNTGVDNVRELIENSQYSASRGRFKVYLIDEVHMLSKSAFNALLKTLEEPPAHVKFLLATTDPQKLPVTVLSRCLKFNLKRLLPEQISGQMRLILDAEKIAYEPAALSELARAADGSLRDGLSLLDQTIAYGAGAVRASEVRLMLGTLESGEVLGLLRAIQGADGNALLAEVNRLAEFSPDFGLVLDELAGALHRIQLKQLVPKYVEADVEVVPEFDALASTISAEEVQLFYQLAITGRRDLPLAPTARAGFEMVLLRMLAFKPLTGAVAPGSLIAAPRATVVPIATKSAAEAELPLANARSNPATSSPATISPNRFAAIPVPLQRAGGVGESPRAASYETQAATRPPSAVVTAAVAPSIALADITANDWPALIESAGLRGPAGQLAQHAAMLGLDGDTLRLALKAAHQHLNSPTLVTLIEQKLSAALATTIKVRIERAGDNIETPADQSARTKSAQQQAAETSMNADPVVQALMQSLGARIVPNSIKPLENES